MITPPAFATQPLSLESPEQAEPSKPLAEAAEPAQPAVQGPRPASVFPDVRATPTLHGIAPVTVKRTPLSKHFHVSDQQLLILEYDNLSQKMQALHNQQPGFKAFTQQNPAEPAAKYAEALQRYWTDQQPDKFNPASPQNQLMDLHRQMLSTQAALRVVDGTLSPASKRLIDTALQYPALAARERAIPAGARPGVYPLAVNDSSKMGALLAGAFMISSRDGSSSTPPPWPDSGRTLLADDQNGPVVLYTPSEGFEEFDTPAHLRAALVQRLNDGGSQAGLLTQSLASPVASGEELLRAFVPLAGDPLAEIMPFLLQRQYRQVAAALAQLTPGAATAAQIAAVEAASQWDPLLDGDNAMLARNELLARKQQPHWLKNLTPAQELFYLQLQHAETASAALLAPKLATIPSLNTFAKERLNSVIQEQYPSAQIDPDRLMVSAVTQTRVHTGRQGVPQDRWVSTRQHSLTELALKNPSQWPAGERGKHTEVTYTLALTDAQGVLVLDAAGQPVKLGTEQLKALVNRADVGGQYTQLLEKQLTTEAPSAEAAALHSAWKANQLDAMKTEAFVAQLNPEAYTQPSTTDSSVKRGALWVAAVLDHPDPAERPQVDGNTLAVSALHERGLPVQGVFVIHNDVDESLVLYTHDSPDGLAFRELANRAALQQLLADKKWQLYSAQRKSPVKKDDLRQAVDAAKSAVNDPAWLLNLLVSTHKLAGGPITLHPITGNVQDELYRQQTRLLVDKADEQSVSSAEVAAQSRSNKAMFGIEAASIFLELIPVLGRGVSAGVRLGKAALHALRTSGSSLPRLLSQPGRWGATYANFALGGAGIPLINRAPLRPVLSGVGGRTLNVNRQLLPPPATLPPAIPSTSTGITRQAANPASFFPDYTPPVISQYAAPQNVLDGVRMRGDGTYQVGEQWYVRYTDGSGIEHPYPISSAFRIEGGPVRVTNAAGRTVAVLEPGASPGQWRANELRGGMPGPVSALPTSEYLSGSRGNLVEAHFSPTKLPVVRHWFRRDMYQFYQRMMSGQMPARPPAFALPEGATPQHALREAFKVSDVVVLGERHDEIAVLQLLRDSMQTLQESGVRTIALEGVERDATGATIDAGFGRIGAGARPPGMSPTLSEVVEVARQHQITIKPLDHRYLTRRADTPHLYRDAGDNKLGVQRLQEFNYHASRMLQDRAPGEKVLVVVGRAHMNTSQGVPGVAELNGGVGIGVYPADASRKSSAAVPSSLPHNPKSSVIGSKTAGDYQIFQQIT